MDSLGKGMETKKPNKLQNFATYIGNVLEFLLIITLGLGLFIYSSTYTFITNSSTPQTQTYTSFDFLFIVSYEILVLTLLTFYVKHRNWKWDDFNLRFKFNMVWMALLLVLLRESLASLIKIVGFGLNLLPTEEGYSEANIIFESNGISIVLIILVNSIYEELLLIGYTFKRLDKLHPIWIILISAVIRLSFHTYQGYVNMLSIAVMAILYGGYYAKYKKLWPLILAHAIGNSFHFLNLHFHWIRI